MHIKLLLLEGLLLFGGVLSKSREDDWKEAGVTCPPGYYEKFGNQEQGCCKTTGVCADSACNTFGLDNSAKTECNVEKQTTPSSNCYRLECGWVNTACFTTNAGKCYGFVKCSSANPNCQSSLLGKLCLQNGANPPDADGRVNFRICACNADADCKEDDEKCNIQTGFCQSPDPFDPSGGEDCKCENRYRSAACIDLEDGGSNSNGRPQTGGFIEVTVPGCGIGDVLLPTAVPNQFEKLVDRYLCSQPNGCDQDWVCQKHVEETDIAYIKEKNLMNICATSLLPPQPQS